MAPSVTSAPCDRGVGELGTGDGAGREVARSSTPPSAARRRSTRRRRCRRPAPRRRELRRGHCVVGELRRVRHFPVARAWPRSRRRRRCRRRRPRRRAAWRTSPPRRRDRRWRPRRRVSLAEVTAPSARSAVGDAAVGELVEVDAPCGELGGVDGAGGDASSVVTAVAQRDRADAPARLRRRVARWLIDAANVIGSRPDGWWRDRAGRRPAAVDAVRGWAGRTGEEALVVLDAGPPDLLGRGGRVEVVAAPRAGRDAGETSCPTARRRAGSRRRARRDLRRATRRPRARAGRRGGRRGRVPARARGLRPRQARRSRVGSGARDAPTGA